MRRAIERRLLEHPELYSEPLRRTLKPYRKLRVGDYRVVLKIEDRVVTILAVCHRRHVYQRAERRSG
ncbi:MAG: type II toxin-antitoxin system RelE/ParE family toxin [Spirochaetaceae bacterium]|nr:type II toxin-antitoxin system RelE/ParE family toxin [Spirochaetaceae bacterium]